MARADRIALVPAGPLLAVRARLNRDRDCLLVVDTGAERMVISPRIARLLPIDLTRPVARERLMGVGQTDPVPVGRLDRVEVGGVAVNDLLASVFELPPIIPADGLLGLSFLTRFRVTFEFDTRSLVLRARARTNR